MPLLVMAGHRCSPEPRTESAGGGGRQLEPGLDRRVGREALAVDAGAEVRDEGFELAEARVVPPVTCEKPVCGVEPTGVREYLGERRVP